MVEGITNSMGRMVQFEECLAPRDWEIRTEVKQMGLLAYQTMFSCKTRIILMQMLSK